MYNHYVIEKEFDILYDVSVLRIKGQIINQRGTVVPSGRVFYHYESGPICLLLADSNGEFELVVKEGEDITVAIPDMGFDRKIVGYPMPISNLYVDLFELAEPDEPSRFNFPVIVFHG